MPGQACGDGILQNLLVVNLSATYLPASSWHLSTNILIVTSLITFNMKMNNGCLNNELLKGTSIQSAMKDNITLKNTRYLPVSETE